MKKYLYKCDNTACNHEFCAENPHSCPKCGGDDFMIISENCNDFDWKKILIIAVIPIALGSIWYFWPEDCNCINHDSGNHIECCSDFPSELGAISYEVGNNFIKVSFPKEKNFTELNFELQHATTGKIVYRKGNKFFPCEDGTYIFKWEDTEEIILNDSNNTIKNFNIESSPHENACEEQVEYIQVKTNSECLYTISTNLDNNDIEVALSENSDFTRGKVKWTFAEAGENPTFYVRKVGVEHVKSRAEKCTKAVLVLPPTASEVVNSYNLYMKDIDLNSQQFFEIFNNRLPEKVVVRGNEMEFMQFNMHLFTEKENSGQQYLDGLRVSESGVIFNSNKTKVIKLIIN